MLNNIAEILFTVMIITAFITSSYLSSRPAIDNAVLLWGSALMLLTLVWWCVCGVALVLKESIGMAATFAYKCRVQYLRQQWSASDCY